MNKIDFLSILFSLQGAEKHVVSSAFDCTDVSVGIDRSGSDERLEGDKATFVLRTTTTSEDTNQLCHFFD